MKATILRGCLWAAAMALASSWANPGWTTVTATQNVQITVLSAVVVTPSSITFPAQTEGISSAPQPIVVTNRGLSTVTFSVSFTGSDAARFAETDNCSGLLAASAFCTIDVTFNPTVSSVATASLVVAVSGGQNYSVTITGNGAPPVTPISITLNPAAVTISDTALAGTVLAYATVQMSDGTFVTQSNYTQFGLALTSSNPAFFAISGFNVVLNRDLSSADDGTTNTTTINVQ